MILDSIREVNDIHQVAPALYPQLAEEIRQFLIAKVSEKGGHLASNLGVVELTMALHIAFDLTKDKLIFDVGHQCYTHKLLTGRREGFDSLRDLGGMSGFPKQAESPCDLFDTGHSSTSISMGLGLVSARDLRGEDHAVISVIGDGSLTGGQAYEALNNASQLKTNFIIVLNDNNMSISSNIGGMSRALQDLRTAPQYNKLKKTVQNALDRIPEVGNSLAHAISRIKSGIKQLVIPGMLFEDMDLTYLGPIDGHNTAQIVDALRDARRVNRAVVVHVVTEKGRGYAPAEKDPEKFHGIGPFDVKTGAEKCAHAPSYTDYISAGLCELAAKDPRVIAVTAAMPTGTGLARFRRLYPDRYRDVGIAEQHAVSYAAGLAAGGLKPYVCIYSTFLQRAYDQIVHDVCLQKAGVTLLIDRAGIVGQDGETHQGMLDASFLRTIPGLTILSPRDGRELLQMLQYSLSFDGPLAIRYPKGSAPKELTPQFEPIRFGKAEVLHRGSGIALLADGSMVAAAMSVAGILQESEIDATIVNLRFLKPLDEELLCELSATHRLAAALEENNRSGALGSALADLTQQRGLPWQILNTQPEDAFIPQGTVSEVRRRLGLDPRSIAERIKEKLSL
ncbi:MAG: 1-deoxy-D-xylulose-5-phosphate synthase [Lachnospiraceae bacterium]|nr:1-deoxy-D-xylulose-5-phosphate synthase [Lachnospiraceae bacterium]